MRRFNNLLLLCSCSCLLTLLLPLSGWASSISIVADAVVSIDEASKTVSVKFGLSNQGDELAREVGVEFPTLNESIIVGKEVYPKQKVEHEQKIKFESLGITEPGTYAIQYRVLYKDANYYPFSAPYVASATLGTAPTRGVNIELTDRDYFKPIAFVDGTDITGGVESITTAALTKVKLDVLSSSEFSIQTPTTVDNGKLELGNSLPFSIKIANRSALPGSEYALILLVSGVSEGKHFAEPFYVRLQLVSQWKFYRNFLIVAVLGIVLVGFVGLRRRKNP